MGRRWGKTQAAKMAILAFYQLARFAGETFRAAYCGPTYAAAKREYNEFKEMCGGVKGRGVIADKSDSDLWIKLRPIDTPHGPTKGALIQFWSLENHEARRGDRLHFVVIDEAKDVKEEAWEATIKPMLLDTKGHALIIGTPKRDGIGFQWFRREFHRGFDRVNYPDHGNMTGPSEGNPFLDPDEAARARRECHDKATEREEYDAEFLDEEGAVFERLEEAFSLPFKAEGANIFEGEAPSRGTHYVIGYDVGRHDDAAIMSVWDWNRQRQVYLWRGVRIPFRQQMSELARLKQRYNDALVISDNNGMGEAVFEDLSLTFGEGIVGRKWNHARKEADVTRASRLFQLAEWKFLAVPWQKQEFYAYMAKKLPMGGYRYEAAPGEHDDAVAAACLVAHKVEQGFPEDAVPEKRVQMIDSDGKVNFDWWLQKKKAEADDLSYFL